MRLVSFNVKKPASWCGFKQLHKDDSYYWKGRWHKERQTDTVQHHAPSTMKKKKTRIEDRTEYSKVKRYRINWYLCMCLWNNILDWYCLWVSYNPLRLSWYLIVESTSWWFNTLQALPLTQILISEDYKMVSVCIRGNRRHIDLPNPSDPSLIAIRTMRRRSS